jgi:hypothetical protein
MNKKKYSQLEIDKLKDMLLDIQKDIKNDIQHPFVDEELLNNISQTIITWKVHNDFGKALSDLMTNKHFLKTMTGFEDWKSLHQDKFKKSAHSLKHIFKKYQTPIPNDWEKIFYDWYFSKHPEFVDMPLHLIPPLDEVEIFNWAKEFSENFVVMPPDKVEAYTNLPHALCILDDLGILDLIDEKFSDKHYKGKKRETDKAKLIATILGMENANNIRFALKNSDFLSDKAKNNAVKTLKSLGLEPSKFID